MAAPARRNRVRAPAVAILLLGGCGLLGGEPEPPELAEVYAARDAEDGEWRLLATARSLHAAGGESSLPQIEALAARHPESDRLPAFLQDLRRAGVRRADELEALRSRYQRLARQEPTARHFWLAGRILPPSEAGRWVDRALELDPDLVPARVLRIGLAARDGDARNLEDLVELLAEHPGSAEGWRLLGHLASVYARPHLALLAAQTEPWLPRADRTDERLVQADRALAAQDPAVALRILDGLEDRRARLARAVALTELDRIEEAEALLASLVGEDPDDPVARFDYGLLAQDHLGRRRLALRQFEAFLALARAGAEVPLQRQIQAELWVEQLRAGGAGTPEIERAQGAGNGDAP